MAGPPSVHRLCWYGMTPLQQDLMRSFGALMASEPTWPVGQGECGNPPVVAIEGVGDLYPGARFLGADHAPVALAAVLSGDWRRR